LESKSSRWENSEGKKKVPSTIKEINESEKEGGKLRRK
jgi:hypothetical protein